MKTSTCYLNASMILEGFGQLETRGGFIRPWQKDCYRTLVFCSQFDVQIG